MADDERRERYKSAIRDAPRRRDGKNPDRQADAAMAEADKEKAWIMQDSAVIAQKWADVADENARLRAELAESQRRAMDSGKEVTRLRAELERTAAYALTADSQAGDHWATIERVRAVRNGWTDFVHLDEAIADIDAALEGEQ